MICSMVSSPHHIISSTILGFGIRLDDGPGFPGAKITPHYDSLLVKITAKARNKKDASAKLIRALREFRVRGVTTNKSFLLNVLSNPDFLNKEVTTSFIAQNPDLMAALNEKDRAQKLLAYIGEESPRLYCFISRVHVLIMKCW